MDNNQVNIKVTQQRVVINTEKSRTALTSPKKLSIRVATVGRQGPVGTVAESVLTMAQQALTMATSASLKADATSEDQQEMVSGMTLTLDHYIGAIAAQE